MYNITAQDVAHYIVDTGTRNHQPVGNLQLNKILYLIQLTYLHDYGMTFFNDDFCAWRYGPVIRSIFYEYNVYYGGKIYKKYDSLLNFKTDDIDLIDKVVKDNYDLYPWVFVKKVHNQCHGYMSVYNEGRGFNDIINIEQMAKDAKDWYTYEK